MKSFTVTFHEGDALQGITVQKLNEEDYNRTTAGGTRHLFELDTSMGFFVFFDAEDEEGNESYMALHYEEENEDPTACYGFDLKTFYEFTALYLNDLEFADEVEDDEQDDEEYGPVHHLAHLLFHIVEDGKDLEA
ncbi:cytosolic protein [Ectobacillus ponti]|uniref:Cytosolic protein n=1 Tax=Ectobacillus ponti TaxID=2961894 RepID=A0AA42BRV4_9BACI|nr:cytosolic protein [Ectobacillus ponti]MCP8970736.1 cytosolic protein [Ectobacillus ponti]